MDPAEPSGLWVCRHREPGPISAPESPPRLGWNGRLSQCCTQGGQRTGPPTPFEGFSGQFFIAQLLGWDHRLVVALESGAMISFGPAARK
jgi:hypothetical protein